MGVKAFCTDCTFRRFLYY